MTRPFRRVSAVAVPTAGAAAVPAGGVPAGAAAAPASNEREYGGSASAAAADKARQEAETEVKSLLGHMAPDRAVPVMRKLGIPVADDDAVAA